MTHQTAVELLMQNIEKSLPNFIEAWRNEFEEAKKMEKELIEKAYADGKFSYLHEGFHITAEHYYNETYGNK